MMAAMTRRILCLSRIDERTDFDTAPSMARNIVAPASGIVYESANLENLIISFDGQQLTIIDTASGNDIAEYDGIFLFGWFKTKILEDLALSVAQYAAAKNIKCLNSEALQTRSRTKLSQYVIAAIHGVQQTPFVFSGTSSGFAEGVATSRLEYPIIVKAVMASRGKDNYLVKSTEELAAILAENPEVAFVAQAFVPNDGDYRLLVMGDEVRFALHRKSQSDSHINNTSQGGLATIIPLEELNPAMLNDAVAIARHLKREVTGVDMIIHNQTGEYYLLEANNMPQLSTGSMVSEKLAALDAFFDDWLRR